MNKSSFKDLFNVNEPFILYRALITPDGTVLESRHSHDYVSHTDTITGEYYMLDGGTDSIYYRTTMNNIKGTLIEFKSNDNFEEIRKVVSRGTFDKDGNRIYVTLDKLSNGHLNSVILYNELNFTNKEFIKKGNFPYIKELEYREKNNIFIDECEYY